MRIALDYDKTYSLDPEFWEKVAVAAELHGHEVAIVTIRDPVLDRTLPLRNLEGKREVFYTRGVAKRWYLTHFGQGFVPDVWIDDNPDSIVANSTATPEGLAKWRAERGEPV
ncbi:hypothetical protein [Devosia sp. 66-22]|uniref:hypothetical protein n=1 Tax=Devosia sp. 66-22 TaxID=1895753 RepID=UPI00092AA175|nr:hypothetical protein [Devosia sp. 66-22]OJX48981.1 MAG: hypothetical protein BGO81_10325 [Devosia sp. 66-22]